MCQHRHAPLNVLQAFAEGRFCIKPELTRCALLPAQERKLRKGLAELQEAHAQQVAAVLDKYTALRAAVDQHHRQLEQVWRFQ